MTRKILLTGSALVAAIAPGSALGAGGGGEGGDGSAALSGNLVAMDAIAVPIVDGARLQGSLRFTVVIEASDRGAAMRLAGDMPGLRAEALATGAEFSRLRASPFLAVDARRLSSDLTDALSARDEGIARVLLVEVVAKPG